jgi:hypothetical protein
MRPSRFQPVTPRNAAAIIAPRVGAHRCLYYDAGSRVALPSPYGDGRTFYYTRADWSEGVSWVSFTVNGHTFTRRAREVQIGNSGCTWVRIAGESYQIYEDIGLLG